MPPPSVALLPFAIVRFRRVRWTPGLTVKTRTALPPLRVTLSPVASTVRSVAITLVVVIVIVPWPANPTSLTLPVRAASSSVSLLTMVGVATATADTRQSHREARNFFIGRTIWRAVDWAARGARLPGIGTAESSGSASWPADIVNRSERCVVHIICRSPSVSQAPCFGWVSTERGGWQTGHSGEHSPEPGFRLRRYCPARALTPGPGVHQGQRQRLHAG